MWAKQGRSSVLDDGRGAMTGALIPFDPREAMSVSEASRRWKIQARKLRRWAEERGIGRTIGGRVLLSQPALIMLLEGDDDALQQYLLGDRSSFAVTRYFDRCGLQGVPFALSQAQKIMGQTGQTGHSRQGDIGRGRAP